jgi:hypothetical protein
MIAVSPDEAGEDALDWLMNELVEDGDEVVALRVLELDEDGELGKAREAGMRARGAKCQVQGAEAR